MNDREVELIDYLRVLWRQKWVITVTFIAAIVAAWGAGRAFTPTYQTKTSLLLLPPLSSQLDAEAVGSRLAPEAYQELAVSSTLLAAVIESAGLPAGVTIDDLKKRLSVSVKRLSSEGELLLSATIRGPNPDQLPEIAAAWTASFTETYGELFQDRIGRSYDYISENYAQTEAELERLLGERRDLLLDHPVGLLQTELSALQQNESTNRSRLAAAQREHDTTEIRIAALTEELALQPFSYTLRSSLQPDSLVAALGAGLTARDIQTLADIRTESEYPNNTYHSINSQIASGRASLRELEEEVRIREEEEVSLREELDRNQAELTDAQVRLDDYDRRIDLLKAAHARLASSLQDARIALAETPEPIRVIDEPLVPRSPIAPKKTTNLAVAGFLGLIVGTLLAFFVDYLARERERERKGTPLSPSERKSDEPRRQQADDNAQPNSAEDG